MIHYHDTSRPAPSRERARCGRAIPQQPGYCCAELLDITTDGHGRHVEACPACDWGWRRTRAAIPIDPAVPAPSTEEFRKWGGLARHAAERKGDDEQKRAAAIAAVQRFVKAMGRAPTYDEMGAKTRVYVPGLPSRMVIDRLFGSRRQLLDAAEVPVALRRVSGRFRMVPRGVVP